MIRERWQHDGLRDHDRSDNVTEEDIRYSNENGKLRPDPVGNLIGSRAKETATWVVECDKNGHPLVTNHLVTNHLPVIDLDCRHVYVPSKTPGHAHLYINEACTSEDYENLLVALRKCGIIGQGIVNQFKVNKQTFVRLPPDYYKSPQTYNRLLEMEGSSAERGTASLDRML